MLTIRDQAELRRFRKILSAHDNSTVAFPLTLYRDTGQVAVFQSSGFYAHVYAYTKDGKAKMRLATDSKESREAWEKREKAFEAH